MANPPPTAAKAAPSATPIDGLTAPRIPATRPEGIPGQGRVAYWYGGQLIELDLATWTEKAVAAVNNPSMVAFDFEGRRVAIVDNNPTWPPRELNLINLSTGKVEPMKASDDVRGVVWSPSGRYLAVESGTAYVGSVSIIDLSTSERSQVAVAGQIDGSFSEDSRYYAYSFPVDVGLEIEGGGSSGIAVFDLAASKPAATVLLDGLDGFSYDLREWVKEGVVYSRRKNGEPVEIDSYGLAALNGETTVLWAGDPRLRLAKRDAMGRFGRIGEIRGPQWDLSPDGRWFVANLQIGDEVWVIVWDTSGDKQPVPLAKAEGAVWVPGTEVGP
ncbi:MAG: WD40 repeat domain-containing protein [Bacillota bacterium]